MSRPRPDRDRLEAGLHGMFLTAYKLAGYAQASHRADLADELLSLGTRLHELHEAAVDGQRPPAQLSMPLRAIDPNRRDVAS